MTSQRILFVLLSRCRLHHEPFVMWCQWQCYYFYYFHNIIFTMGPFVFIICKFEFCFLLDEKLNRVSFEKQLLPHLLNFDELCDQMLLLMWFIFNVLLKCFTANAVFFLFTQSVNDTMNLIVKQKKEIHRAYSFTIKSEIK